MTELNEGDMILCKNRYELKELEEILSKGKYVYRTSFIEDRIWVTILWKDK